MAAQYSVFVMGVASLLVTLVAAHDAQFGYSGSNGPDNWGNLSPDFSLCSSGKSQSPVDIKKKDLVFNPSLKCLDRNYVDSNATLINTGIDIQLLFENGAGSVSIDEKNYTLHQVHWHTPSEHTINGERYPVELQLVHQSADGNVAAIAILYKYGNADSFVDEIKETLAQLTKGTCSEDEELHLAAGEVDTKSLARHTRKYYRYVGSFSTPPCTENVIWTVFGKVRSISKDQVAALQAPLVQDFKNNSRPTQPLNGRTVELFDEGRSAKSHSQ